MKRIRDKGYTHIAQCVCVCVCVYVVPLPVYVHMSELTSITNSSKPPTSPFTGGSHCGSTL